jgi:hypothetical protein
LTYRPRALLLIFGAMASAHAQSSGGPGGRQQKLPTTPTAIPEQGAQLDVGAVLRKSLDDLVRDQTQIPAGPATQITGHGPDCHTIRKQTGIEILDRDGASRTQVVTTDESKQAGWTNAYLRSTPPPYKGVEKGN